MTHDAKRVQERSNTLEVEAAKKWSPKKEIEYIIVSWEHCDIIVAAQ